MIGAQGMSNRSRLAIGLAVIVLTALTTWIAYGPTRRIEIQTDDGFRTRSKAAPTLSVPVDPKLTPLAEDHRTPTSSGDRVVSRDARLTLHCIDKAGSMLAHVRLWVRKPGVSRAYSLEGESDASGLIILGVQDSPRECLAQHAGSCILGFWIDALEAGDRDVVIDPGGVLTGIVECADRAADLASVTVVAYPRWSPPSKQQLSSALHAEGQLPVGSTLTRCASSGDFRLEGLVRGIEYSLIAGGPGLLCQGPRTGLHADDPPLSVVLEKTFGLMLKIRSKSGDRDIGAGDLWMPPGPRWFWNNEAARGLPSDSLSAVLSGLPLDLTGRSNSSTLTLLFTSPAAVSRVGPISLSGTLAGHEPINTELWAPTWHGNITQVDLDVLPVTGAWGSAVVEFVSFPTRTDEPSESALGNDGFLLFAENEGQGLFEYKFLSVPHKAIVVDSIPAGSYYVTLHTSQGYRNFQPTSGNRPIAIGGPRASITFDMSDEIEAELHVLQRNGHEWSDELTVELGRTDDDGTRHSAFVVFTAPPYVLKGLIAREYAFRIYRPFYSPTAWELDLGLPLDATRRQALVMQE